MNRILIAIAIAAALVVAVMIGLRAGSPSSTGLLAARKLVESPPVPDVQPMPVADASAPPDVAAFVEQLTGVKQAAVSPAPPPPPEPEGMSGPAKIAAWLASSTDNPTVANTVLAGFPSLKPEDHLLAVSKLVALVSDDRFEGVKRLLLDPKTTTEAKEFLFRDALSRAESLKLPLLLAIMQMPEHPCEAEARDTLKTQLGVDYGVNYGQWQAKISEVLRAQQ